MKSILLLPAIIIFSLAGWQCNQTDEDATRLLLQQKEEKLAAKEDSLLRREQELIAREKRLDSIDIDSAVIIDSSILGAWDVKMVCAETTCPGSAVGDTKIEVWNLTYEHSSYIASASAGGEIIRVYRGILKENTLEMNLQSPASPAGEPLPKMFVRINKTGDRFEGVREITRDDCRIVYSVEMTRKS